CIIGELRIVEDEQEWRLLGQAPHRRPSGAGGPTAQSARRRGEGLELFGLEREPAEGERRARPDVTGERRAESSRQEAAARVWASDTFNPEKRSQKLANGLVGFTGRRLARAEVNQPGAGDGWKLLEQARQSRVLPWPGSAITVEIVGDLE